MISPLVSCITPTYGRFHLLQEMYWCWLNQTYENKELIIVNDQKNLIIKCDNPNVKIFNFDERFPALGAKRNFCIENVSENAQYILPMDDDDLFLPNHIEVLVNGLIKNPEYDRIKLDDHYTALDNMFVGHAPTKWPFFGASCFNADYLRSCKFDETLTKGEDSDLFQNHNTKTFVINGEHPTFIYRTGMNVIHASGHRSVRTKEHQKELANKITNSVKKIPKPTIKILKGGLRPMSLSLYEMCKTKSE